MSDLDNFRSMAHRKNIQKYRRLLRTPLTYAERRYIQKRLAREQAALERTKLSRDYADADVVIAADALTRRTPGRPRH